MERTAESIIKEMEQTGIMMTPRMTSQDRLNGLQDFQRLVLRMVYNDDHAENLRLWDVIDHFEKLARDKGHSENETILSAIEDLETIAKEIAIAISGSKGEQQVARALRYTYRDMRTLQNVNLQEGEDKTELDQIIITSSGILILEVKNYKKDITISESGHIYGPNDKCYCDKNLGVQMNIKRYLLRSKLERALAQVAPELKVHIESRVVFSDPSIRVTDLYKQEPYCFKSSLPHEIEQFISDVHYTREQMWLIADVIKGFAEEDAAYDVGLDFDRIRKTFAEAMIILEGDYAEDAEEPEEDPVIPAEVVCRAPISAVHKIAAVTASLLAVAGVAFALAKKK